MENIVESNWSLWFVYIPVRHGSPKNEKCLNMKIDFSLPISIRFFFHLQAPRLFYPEINFPFNWANWIMCLPSKSYETFACLQKQKNSQFTHCFCFDWFKNNPTSQFGELIQLKVVSNSYMHACVYKRWTWWGLKNLK